MDPLCYFLYLVLLIVWLGCVSCSPDGKFLVSLGNRGAGRVWDLASSAVATPLAKENVSCES